MPSDNCYVLPGDMRVVYYESTSQQYQVAYTVPQGKVFVLTAWTMVNEMGQRVSVRLRRSKQRVAVNRVSDPAIAHCHMTFPTGIAFGSGAELELEAPSNACQHYFYGYEIDDQ